MKTINQLNYTNEFKFHVALEAIKNNKTVSEIATANKISNNLVIEWKKYLLDYGSDIFAKKDEYEPDLTPYQNISYEEKIEFLTSIRHNKNI